MESGDQNDASISLGQTMNFPLTGQATWKAFIIPTDLSIEQVSEAHPFKEERRNKRSSPSRGIMNSPPSAKDEPVCPYLRNERLKMIVWYCLIIVLYSSIGWQWRRSTRITQTHNHSFKWNRKVARFYIHLNLFLIIFTRPDIYCCLDHNNRWVAGQRVPITSKHLSI